MVHRRDVLLRKTILSVDNSGCPIRDAPLETASHMVFHCPAVAPFGASLGVLILHEAHVRDLHLLPMPAAVAPETTWAFSLLCCWYI
jgi:hypothetical protein